MAPGLDPSSCHNSLSRLHNVKTAQVQSKNSETNGAFLKLSCLAFAQLLCSLTNTDFPFTFSQQRGCDSKSVLWLREGRKKGPGTKARPQEFAEPGTLSSTFPTNLPFPRSAPRGASSYRRPVLGAGGNLRHETRPIKGVRYRKFTLFAPDGSARRRRRHRACRRTRGRWVPRRASRCEV